jgi:hypothetical protein
MTSAEIISPPSSKQPGKNHDLQTNKRTFTDSNKETRFFPWKFFYFFVALSY